MLSLLLTWRSHLCRRTLLLDILLILIRVILRRCWLLISKVVIRSVFRSKSHIIQILGTIKVMAFCYFNILSSSARMDSCILKEIKKLKIITPIIFLGEAPSMSLNIWNHWMQHQLTCFLPRKMYIKMSLETLNSTNYFFKLRGNLLATHPFHACGKKINLDWIIIYDCGDDLHGSVMVDNPQKHPLVECWVPAWPV